ncbi:hypothetical protein EDB84DRAFT_740189 [Lactarius hengduanensis]|nr:hypothetical protein EDB84DRAFT_740189 [Lactarius hengduanensis]
MTLRSWSYQCRIRDCVTQKPMSSLESVLQGTVAHEICISHRSVCLSTLTASQMARRHSNTGRAFPRLVLPLFILTPYSLPTASPLNMSRHFTTIDHFGHATPLSLLCLWQRCGSSYCTILLSIAAPGRHLPLQLCVLISEVRPYRGHSTD